MTRLITLFVLLPSALHGQSPPAVDSSAAARTAWQAAVAAQRQGQGTAAVQHTLTATRAWPEQPYYHEMLGLLAARANDTTSLLQAVRALTAMQSGARLEGDSSVVRLRQAPAVDAAVRMLSNALAPLRESTVWAQLSDSTIYPEGTDADPATGVIYLGSIRHRTVYRVRQGDKTATDLGLGSRPDIGAVMGVRFDTPRNLLWLTTVGLPTMAGFRAADTSLAALVAVRPDNGQTVHRFDLPPGEPHLPGDLAIGPRGDVFVTDSRSPILYRLAPGGAALEAIRHPLFRSLQGLAPTEDGRYLYLADYAHGLLRLDLSSQAVSRVELVGGGTSLGIDGMVLAGNRLYAVQNGVAPPRVVRFELESGGATARVRVVDRHLPLADEPTILTVLGNQVIYVANSQWEKYDDAGARRPGTTLKGPVLLALPTK
ncbi:MAG: SMP-30/gluconolactonase/LRE family protein [Gemmatimonadales bacterium]